MFDFDFDSIKQDAANTPKFKIGDEVVDPSSGLSGFVVKVENPLYAWMGFQYEVVLSNGIKSLFNEDSLQEMFNTSDVFQLCENRNFSNYDDYMIVNTLFKIDNVNNNTISTLRASKTQFKAYQFKPLLKFFASPDKRILIADEVGLGKTIEAGHILLELRARKELRHSLIICPKSLREKWRKEMEDRFGLDFTIYGGEDNEGAPYPTIADLLNAYDSGHDVRAIINYEQIRYRKDRHRGSTQTRSQGRLIKFILENNIQHSVVICDESHRLRNEDTLSYSGAEILLSKSDAVIFLTATPVMIKEENLYNQMHLLCPEKYSDTQIFSNRMAQGRPFVLALSELSAGLPLPQVWKRLHTQKIERVIEIGLYVYRKEMTVEECFSSDPVYERIRTLFGSDDNARTRAALQLNLVKMSAIHNEFTRTTKSQIRNELSKVNERFPCKVTISLTKDEQKEFDRVINEYDENRNATGTSSLGLVQVKRMVSSSVYAYCNRREDLELGFDAYADKPDSKVEALLSEILQPSESNHMRDVRKVIVFAVFVDTLRYLKIRLARHGVACLMIDGSVADRQDVIDRFRADDKVRVLLSSEVGSEGLDMQFCDTIVNYDLPWNPMVVEQRIGRIDRIGQVSDNIYIYNFVVKDSISEDIYDRLETRIGIFKGTIGDLEPILSAPYKDGQTILEAHNNLETRYYKGEISRDQALKEEELIRQAIETQRMTLEQLSSEMSKNTVSMDSYYDEQINFIQKRKAYVTDVELRNLLSKVLSVPETGCSQCVLELSHDNPKVWTLKIPQNLDDRECLEKFLRIHRPHVSDSLKAYDEFLKKVHGKFQLKLTFDQGFANENRNVIFINNYCPLILACNEYRTRSGIAVRKVFKLELRPNSSFDGVLSSGDKFFLLNYQLLISGDINAGSRTIKELKPVLFDIRREEIVLDEDVISGVCSLAQDCGREAQMPSAAECSHGVVSKFKSLATHEISRIVDERKRDIDEQNNVERNRWIREYTQFYDGKIQYYKQEIIRRQNELRCMGASFGANDDGISKIKNEIAGYSGAVTKLNREKEIKLTQMSVESNVSITREVVSVCYVVVK